MSNALINAQIAQGFRGNQKAWDPIESKNNAMQTVLNERKLAAQPVMQALDARAMQIKQMAMNAQQEAMKQGPEVALDYPTFSVKGPKDAMMKFTQGVIDYPDQVDDPGFMGWVSGLGLSVERKEAKKSTWGQPKAGLDESGNPVYFRTDKEGNTKLVEGYKPVPKKGMKIYGENGNVIAEIGGSGGDMQRKTKSVLESDVLANDKLIVRLENVLDGFDREFLTYQGKLKAAGLKIADKANVDLSKENKKFLEDYTTFTQDSIENINRYIKEITGAQMSEAEANRLRKAVADAGDGVLSGDSPSTFLAKANNAIKKAKIAKHRALMLREQGLEWDDMSEEKRRRAELLYGDDEVQDFRGDQLKASGMTDEEVVAQLKKEGLL